MNKLDLMELIKENKEKAVILATGFGCNIEENALNNKEMELLKNKDYLKNYRYRLYNLKIDNIKTIVETGLSYRYKNGVAVSLYNLYLDVHQFENDIEHGNLKIENKIQDSNYLYTETDLLKAINSINDYKIDHVIYENNKFDFYNILNKDLNILGNREKEIIDNLEIITESENNKDHHIIAFYAIIKNKIESFEYDIIKREIIG